MLRWLVLTLALGLVACAGLSQVPPESIEPTSAASPVEPADGDGRSHATVPPPPSPTPVLALPDASTAAWVPVVAGLDRPVDLKHAGDGRLFVVEKQGVIRIVRDDVLLPEPFVDLRDRVGSGASEQGLLGLAFHPRFAENGRLFVNYTDTAGDTVVARYLASGDRADPASEVILLRIAQPFANHNGGSLAFGPDGYLYIGTGDGGSGGDPHGNGQSLNTLLGKILRLDVDGGEPYAIPADNPFAGSGEVYPEIWASGLRNPWRIAFDRPTGDLYIGDVGQNRWEEIDVRPGRRAGRCQLRLECSRGTARVCRRLDRRAGRSSRRVQPRPRLLGDGRRGRSRSGPARLGWDVSVRRLLLRPRVGSAPLRRWHLAQRAVV